MDITEKMDDTTRLGEERSDEQAKLIFAKFRKFDGENGFYWCGGYHLIVQCKKLSGGWLFKRLKGGEVDFQYLMGNREDSTLLLPLPSGGEDPLIEIREMCKSEFLDNRQLGFLLLTRFLKPLRLGDLVSLGMAEKKDERIKHMVSDIVMSLFSGGD